MKTNKLIYPFLTLLLFSSPLRAASNDAGLPGAFLDFGAGARPLGMGSAFTGVADDIDALYWNPAGIATFRSSQVTFQYAPLELGGAYQYGAYSQPIYDMGSFGVGIVNLGSDNVPRMDINGTEIGSFQNRETGYLASYGYQMKDKMALGGTFKMAEHVIDGRSARGFGADVGGLYMVNPKFKLGLMMRNLAAPSYKFDTDTETFPRVLRGGASYKLFKDHLLTSVDLSKTIGTSQSLGWNVGVEGYVIPAVTLRGGLNKNEIAMGLGLKYKTFQFDYGAGFQEMGLTNRFSIKMFFGGFEVDIKAAPAVFSPVGLKNKTTLHVNAHNRDRIINWILSIKNGKGEVVRGFQGYNAPPSTIEWDGKNAQGQIVEPGEYSYRMSVTDNRNRTEMTPIRYLRIEAPTPLEIEAK